MNNTGKLAGRTIFITGASRGIGRAIAVKCARDGANIVIAAKTTKKHPHLNGTIYTAAEDVERVGGKALACVVDVRNEIDIKNAISNAVEKFGGIDIVVNNAAAVFLTNTEETDMDKYDLMHEVNARGTYLVSKLCLPFLKNSSHAHILNISPPLQLLAEHFQNYPAYVMSKYFTSMCVICMTDEFKDFNISVNALWPRVFIWTTSMRMLMGHQSANHTRSTDIMADAAYHILCQNPANSSGNFFIDEDVLKDCGVKDFDRYAMNVAYKNQLLLSNFAVAKV